MTSTSEQPVVNLAEMPLQWLKRGGRFEVGLSDIDRPLGLSGIGATLHVVPAGKTAWPFHRHHCNDELFLVLEGSGECAEKGWVFLHLSIAGWTLVFFVAMIAASLALTRRD